MSEFGSRCHTEIVLKDLIKTGTLSECNQCGLFLSSQVLLDNMNEVRNAFPEPFFKHRYAIKANPIKRLLHFIEENGFGAECASAEELHIAQESGMKTCDIVYDSPLKSCSVIEDCFKKGIHINFDNLQEMELGYQIYHTLKVNNEVKIGSVGVRINSQYGKGSIEATSTVTPTSKFGVPFRDTDYQDLLAFFKKWPELNGLHSHVGSQGMDLGAMVQGVKFIVELADRINRDVGRQQITVIDIGGGLPVDYHSDDSNHLPVLYSQQLRAEVPRLFSGDFTVITEFGRWLIANAGWFVSRIEFTKVAGGVLVGITHAGGNMFVREVYMPSTWYHPLTVYDRNGNLLRDNRVIASIAGPLCFSGDLIVKERELPRFEQGDYAVYHHTGAYSISMYSMYNCISAPPAYFYTIDPENGSVTIELIKRQMSIEDISQFWSV